MLMEALLLRGKDSPWFEHVGPDATMAEMVVEVVYKEFYKQDFKWMMFAFEDGIDLIQF